MFSSWTMSLLHAPMYLSYVSTWKIKLNCPQHSRKHKYSPTVRKPKLPSSSKPVLSRQLRTFRRFLKNLTRTTMDSLRRTRFLRLSRSLASKLLKKKPRRSSNNLITTRMVLSHSKNSEDGGSPEDRVWARACRKLSSTKLEEESSSPACSSNSLKVIYLKELKRIMFLLVSTWRVLRKLNSLLNWMPKCSLVLMMRSKIV